MTIHTRQPLQPVIIVILHTLQASSHLRTLALKHLFFCFLHVSVHINLIQFSAPPLHLAFPNTSSLDFILHLPYYACIFLIVSPLTVMDASWGLVFSNIGSLLFSTIWWERHSMHILVNGYWILMPGWPKNPSLIWENKPKLLLLCHLKNRASVRETVTSFWHRDAQGKGRWHLPGTCVLRLALFTLGPQCSAETKRISWVLTTVTFSSWLGAQELSFYS